MNYFIGDDFRIKHRRFSPYTIICDAADYPRGFVFRIPGLTIFKIKKSKIMENDRFITVISIFGREFGFEGTK